MMYVFANIGYGSQPHVCPVHLIHGAELVAQV
jgi:hypothetical protein